MSYSFTANEFNEIFRNTVDKLEQEARDFKFNHPEWRLYEKQMYKFIERFPQLSYEEIYTMVGGDMGRVRVAGQEFDTGNISGSKLAEIGRWALTGKQIVDKEQRMDRGDDIFVPLMYDTSNPHYPLDRKIREGDYTAEGWLDMRINEICRKGRL